MKEEYVNKIELAGRIGSVRKNTISDTEHARFSLCTMRVYQDGEYPVAETSWHACHAFASDGIDLAKIEKGEWIHIIGRLKYTKYVDINNVEKQMTDIFVTKIINDEED
nr:MAG TPA: hypothetical protein [Caudoviricetes sp.]